MVQKIVKDTIIKVKVLWPVWGLCLEDDEAVRFVYILTIPRGSNGLLKALMDEIDSR